MASRRAGSYPFRQYPNFECDNCCIPIPQMNLVIRECNRVWGCPDGMNPIKEAIDWAEQTFAKTAPFVWTIIKKNVRNPAVNVLAYRLGVALWKIEDLENKLAMESAAQEKNHVLDQSMVKLVRQLKLQKRMNDTGAVSIGAFDTWAEVDAPRITSLERRLRDASAESGCPAQTLECLCSCEDELVKNLDLLSRKTEVLDAKVVALSKQLQGANQTNDILKQTMEVRATTIAKLFLELQTVKNKKSAVFALAITQRKAEVDRLNATSEARGEEITRLQSQLNAAQASKAEKIKLNKTLRGKAANLGDENATLRTMAIRRDGMITKLEKELENEKTDHAAVKEKYNKLLSSIAELRDKIAALEKELEDRNEEFRIHRKNLATHRRLDTRDAKQLAEQYRLSNILRKQVEDITENNTKLSQEVARLKGEAQACTCGKVSNAAQAYPLPEAKKRRLSLDTLYGAPSNSDAADTRRKRARTSNGSPSTSAQGSQPKSEVIVIDD